MPVMRLHPLQGAEMKEENSHSVVVCTYTEHIHAHSCSMYMYYVHVIYTFL